MFKNTQKCLIFQTFKYLNFRAQNSPKLNL